MTELILHVNLEESMCSDNKMEFSINKEWHIDNILQ